MDEAILRRMRQAARVLVFGTAGAAGAMVATSSPASAATIATFNNGVLTVIGDGNANVFTIGRDAAGKILINGGAVAVHGGTPTVANTRIIQGFGLGGADSIILDEANGALPRANLFGGSGDDTLGGGSGPDLLFGLDGNDTMIGRGGSDQLFGGGGNDGLTGGDADDVAFGGGNDDTMIWNPGDDTDLNEGGGGTDIVQVNGGAGAETFTSTRNGARVRFDRIDPAPFAIDIGTSEKLMLNANGGDDRFSATGDLAALIAITADGGAGRDILLGSNGADMLIGGDDDDFVDGQQGADIAVLGAGNDTFQWDPGDASDVVEGQAGTDTMVFNGSGGDELIEASANGGRARLTRNLGNIVMDLDDVETFDVNALGGADTVKVNDVSGTDVVEVAANLASAIGGTAGDGREDSVVVDATNGDDVVVVAGDGGGTSVLGLAARVSVSVAEAADDRLTINALGGADIVDASGVQAGAIRLTADGGAGDDVLIGGAGDDVLSGGPGDDVLLGGDGTDVIDGGEGDDIEIPFAAVGGDLQLATAGGDAVTSATTADAAWLREHVTMVNGTTVITIGGKSYPLPNTDLTALVAAAAETPQPLGDLVWNDADADGIQDPGEAGIAGVVVRLLDGAGSVVDEDVTDSDGRYEVGADSASPVTLEVVVPAGYQPTTADAGPDDAVDSDADPATLTPGPTETTLRVPLGDPTAIVADTVDVGLIPPAAEQPAPTTVPIAPTTAADPTTTTSTTVPPTVAPPTVAPTTVPPTVAPTPAPTVPTTVAPVQGPATTAAPAPAG